MHGGAPGHPVSLGHLGSCLCPRSQRPVPGGLLCLPAVCPLLADPFADQERGFGLLRPSPGCGAAPGQDVWGPGGALGWDLWRAGAAAQPLGSTAWPAQPSHVSGAFSSPVCRGVRDSQRPPSQLTSRPMALEKPVYLDQRPPESVKTVCQRTPRAPRVPLSGRLGRGLCRPCLGFPSACRCHRESLSPQRQLFPVARCHL